MLSSQTQPQQPKPPVTTAERLNEAHSRALRIIVERGAVYRHANKYSIVRVHVRNRYEAQLLLDVFAGCAVKRANGRLVWSCGKLPTLVFLRRNIGDALHSERFKRLLQDARLE